MVGGGEEASNNRRKACKLKENGVDAGADGGVDGGAKEGGSRETEGDEEEMEDLPIRGL